MADLTTEQRARVEKTFVWWLALLATFVAFVPAIYAALTAPSASTYLGFEYNTDDHMVYSAWMRQGMEGHFLMDNRFTTDPQPGLTIHLYFFALGLLAKLIGIPIAAALGRALFSVIFVLIAHKLIGRMNYSIYATKLALALVVVASGIGFLVWRNFGVDITPPAPSFFSGILLGHLPTDVWQPEGFVFSSMLTNGLFMVSLCLILWTFISFLKAREDPKAVWGGFVAVAILMNVHSYDVLLIALVMAGVLAAVVVRKQLTPGWIGRALVIAAGAVLPALWFVHVLQNDKVFQARAATETFSPNFRPLLAGYLALIVLGLIGAALRAKSEPEEKIRRRRYVGVALASGLFLGLAVMAGGHQENTYFLSPLGWGAAFAIAIASVALMADEDPTWNLMMSWAIVGTVAIYFPGLFQRKLTMGLSIPWAVVSAYAIDTLVTGSYRQSRNLTTVLALIALGATSMRWLFREMQFIRLNVSNTTRHTVFLSPDMQRVLAYLNGLQGRNVLLALPGAANPTRDGQTGEVIPDSFQSPIIPDMAPICTGLTGIYSYAGHWSETPDYEAKTAEMYRFFLREPFSSVHQVMSAQERADLIRQTGATYALMPSADAIPALPLILPTSLGEVVYKGTQFVLIKLKSLQS